MQLYTLKSSLSPFSSSPHGNSITGPTSTDCPLFIPKHDDLREGPVGLFCKWQAPMAVPVLLSGLTYVSTTKAGD